MRSEEIYDAWKEVRSQVDVSEGFAGKVMGQVYEYEQEKGKAWRSVERFVEFISARPLAAAGLAAGCLVLGLVRLVCALIVALGRHAYCG